MIELFPKRGEAGFSPNINFLATPMHDVIDRVVHGSDGPAGRVGSGRVTILPDFGGSDRVGSDYLSAIAGRVGSTFRRVGSGWAQEK